MAGGLVIHIAAGDDRHTEIVSQDRVRIGASADCDLQLRASALTTSPIAPGVALELTRTNGHYRVTEFNPSLGITQNGEPLIEDARIAEGDEFRFSSSNLALQFFPVNALPALVRSGRETQVAPFIEQAALESAATARRDDAKVFLREFTRELVQEIKMSTKLIALAISLALVGGMLYIGFAVYKEIQRNRRLVEDQKAELSDLKNQIGKTSEQISGLNQSNQTILDSLSLAPKMRSDYGGGVCLISGSYYFVEARTGRPLRYPEVQTDDEGVVIQSGTEPLQLTPEGKGVIAEYEFVGTGFYVGDGFVLTNRHVAQPWQADDRAQSLTSSVSAQPRLKKLIAYFPDLPQPFNLKFKMAAQADDLAVCTFDIKDVPTKIPVLPLDKETSDAIGVGKTVVMMGYPNGPDRLLALRDDAEARMIQARCGSSLESLLSCLADKSRIQPLTTQGNITDLDTHRIVYDARTAEGGSGAPLFGQTGRVIGINFAVFTENTASNFAVPVRFGLTLLQRAGWKSPETVETANQNENSNTNQTAPRNSNAAANASR
ncbi:MAG TPA: trypsin-like peptidase domain-containing protein [Pyrinomonadaceae bacterium]|jgi:S1-C subfamily serine protease/cell division protein FtsB